MSAGVPILRLDQCYRLAVHDVPQSANSTAAIDFDVLNRARVGNDPDLESIRVAAREIVEACESVGFFYVSGVPNALLQVQSELEVSMRRFFELPVEEKMKISMARGGRAWRGYFPVGAELTSGAPDMKEGLYLGKDLVEPDDRVRRGVPLHGPNLYPSELPEMGPLVRAYMQGCGVLGQLLMGLLAAGLELDSRYFAADLVADHLPLFRAFHYPPQNSLNPAHSSLWGVGEHTDYGLLTLLKQDDVGGLEVRALDGVTWLPVPPIADTFVVNIGDTLECITSGLLRSTPHRVRNASADRMRVTMPFFFDPGFEAVVNRVPLNNRLQNLAAAHRGRRAAQGFTRWDSAVVPEVAGEPYGRYLTSKVSKVFPELASAKL
jgi:isopenicillin N synthase-like dioxygenase